MNLLDLFEKEIEKARSSYGICKLQMDVEMFL